MIIKDRGVLEMSGEASWKKRGSPGSHLASQGTSGKEDSGTTMSRRGEKKPNAVSEAVRWDTGCRVQCMYSISLGHRLQPLSTEMYLRYDMGSLNYWLFHWLLVLLKDR